MRKFWKQFKSIILNKEINSLYSVIIPTIWAPDENFIFTLMIDLDQSPYVGEIILIDNAPERKIKMPNISKLKYLPQNENIYVNSAWNIGVEEAIYNKIVLCNDDINTNWELFAYIDKLYDESWSDQIGIIGMDENNYKIESINFSINVCNKRNFGYGCLMFLNKKIYKKIPGFLKIWSGDTFLFEHSRSIEKLNFKISGWPVKLAGDKLSVSSENPKFNEIKKNDVNSFWEVDKHNTAKSNILTNIRIIELLTEIRDNLSKKVDTKKQDILLTQDINMSLDFNNKFDHQKTFTFNLLKKGNSLTYASLSRTDIYSLFKNNPKYVVDVGCSRGTVGKALKEKFNDVCVIGFEPDLVAANEAKKHLDFVFSSGLSQSNLTAISHLQAADTILLLDCLEHMFNPWAELEFLAQNVRSDCQLIISLPNVGHIRIIADLINGSFRYTPSGQLDITHLRFFTEYEMYKMIYQTGFRIEEKKYLRTNEGFASVNPHEIPKDFPLKINFNNFQITVKSKEQWIQLNSVLISFRISLCDKSKLSDWEKEMQSTSHISTFVV